LNQGNVRADAKDTGIIRMIETDNQIRMFLYFQIFENRVQDPWTEFRRSAGCPDFFG